MSIYTTPTVGQEVYISTPGSWDTDHRLATVAKVTPSGQITTTRKFPDGSTKEDKFTARGMMMGREGFRTPYLNWDVATIKANLKEKGILREAGLTILLAKDVDYKLTYGREATVEAIKKMEELLNVARAALEGGAA